MCDLLKFSAIYKSLHGQKNGIVSKPGEPDETC